MSFVTYTNWYQINKILLFTCEVIWNLQYMHEFHYFPMLPHEIIDLNIELKGELTREIRGE